MNKKTLVIGLVAVIVVMVLIAVPIIKSHVNYSNLAKEDIELVQNETEESISIPSYADQLKSDVEESDSVDASGEMERVDVNDIVESTETEVVTEEISSVESSTESPEESSTESSGPSQVENITVSFNIVEYSSVLQGQGVVLSSDEEIANASSFWVGDTVAEGSKYVLAYGADFYELIYTEKEWDGFIIQDVTVGTAYASLEEAIENSDTVPAGVPMYLPLNISGAKSIAEFNEVADSIVLIVFDGTNYTKIPFSSLVQ